jgi:hypothetical protein
LLYFKIHCPGASTILVTVKNDLSFIISLFHFSRSLRNYNQNFKLFPTFQKAKLKNNIKFYELMLIKIKFIRITTDNFSCSFVVFAKVFDLPDYIYQHICRHSFIYTRKRKDSQMNSSCPPCQFLFRA